MHTVSGTLSPDATGAYNARGRYNGKDYTQRADDNYFIWWDGTDSWIISAVLGTPGADYWQRTDPVINGTYAPQGTATGTATVAET